MTKHPSDPMKSSAVQDLSGRHVNPGGEPMHSFAKRHMPLTVLL